MFQGIDWTEQPDGELISSWRTLGEAAAAAQRQAASCNDEADEIAGMLTARGYTLKDGRWVKR